MASFNLLLHAAVDGQHLLGHQVEHQTSESSVYLQFGHKSIAVMLNALPIEWHSTEPSARSQPARHEPPAALLSNAGLYARQFHAAQTITIINHVAISWDSHKRRISSLNSNTW